MATFLAALAPGCGQPPGGEPVPDTATRGEAMEDGAGRRSLRAIVDDRRAEWMEHPNVTGVGIGRCEGEPCIVLYLVERTGAAERGLPDQVEGYPVRLEVTGRIVPRTPPGDTGAEGG